MEEIISRRRDHDLGLWYLVCPPLGAARSAATEKVVAARVAVVERTGSIGHPQSTGLIWMHQSCFIFPSCISSSSTYDLVGIIMS